jgi:hypothetical protein
MPVIPAWGRKEVLKFEVSLGYVVRSSLKRKKKKGGLAE